MLQFLKIVFFSSIYSSFLPIAQKFIPAPQKDYKCVHVHNKEVWPWDISLLKRYLKGRENPEFG